MRTLSVTDFREQCLQLLDALPGDGIVITKRGQPIAKVVPVPSSCSDLIGTMIGLVADPQDDLFSTGVAWDAESGTLIILINANRATCVARPSNELGGTGVVLSYERFPANLGGEGVCIHLSRLNQSKL